MLENRYGNKSTIALEIIEDLEKIPILRANKPRKVIDLIQCIEKALDDLTEHYNTGAINNSLVIKSIESRFMVNPANDVTPDTLIRHSYHFDNLLKFLKTREEILEKLEQLGVSEKPEKKLHTEKYASTWSTRKSGCVVCGDEKHREKIFFCKCKWKSCEHVRNAWYAMMKVVNVKIIYLCRNKDCKKSNSPDHNFFLCLKGDFKSSEVEKGGKLKSISSQRNKKNEYLNSHRRW